MLTRKVPIPLRYVPTRIKFYGCSEPISEENVGPHCHSFSLPALNSWLIHSGSGPGQTNCREGRGLHPGFQGADWRVGLSFFLSPALIGPQTEGQRPQNQPPPGSLRAPASSQEASGKPFGPHHQEQLGPIVYPRTSER